MPELPFELEREIFELAFRSHRNAAFKVTLSLVARRVQCWIDLLYYELTTVRDESHADKLLALIESNLNPPNLFETVKTMCLPHGVPATSACRILAACTKVERLACWSNFHDSPELPVLLSQLPLRRLSIELRHFSQIPLTPATWVLGLTHLDIVAWDDYDAHELLRLKKLPQLTHVAVNFELDGMTAEHALCICSSCPLLRILVLVVPEYTDVDLGLEDYRIVVHAGTEEIIADWEAPYFGLPDMWSNAEAIVEQRQLSMTASQ
ncbi:hypothetical protein C8R46DRAFT_623475 [Mycena filopes]|nr:hypothetical protein C8R46DRAFT_623475 [Mycena filopes]